MTLRKCLIAAGVAFVGVVAWFLLFGLSDERHFVPCGFRGPVVIVFGHPDGIAIRRSLTGTYRFHIDASGVLRVSSAPPWEPNFRIRVFGTCDSEREELQAVAIKEGVVALGTSSKTVDGVDWQYSDTSQDPNVEWVSYFVTETDAPLDDSYHDERRRLLEPTLQEAKAAILRTWTE